MEAGQSSSKPRPWLRYWARFIDYAIFAEVIWGLVIPLIPLADDIPSALINLIIVFVWIFVESTFMQIWETTPGKAILAIDLRSADGKEPTFFRHLERSFDVWLRGMGIGFPIASFFTLYYSWSKLDKTGACSWDRDNGFVVSHRNVSPLRGTLAVALIVGILALNIASIASGNE